jgi:hypothetical protein
MQIEQNYIYQLNYYNMFVREKKTERLGQVQYLNSLFHQFLEYVCIIWGIAYFFVWFYQSIISVQTWHVQKYK